MSFARSLKQNQSTTATLIPFKPNGILNFGHINTFIEGKVGYKGAENATLPYVGEKVGGSDVGNRVAMAGEEYIVKTGVTLSMLAKAMLEDRFLTYIVGNFTRIAGSKIDDHPNLIEYKPAVSSKGLIDEWLVSQMQITREAFKTTEAGKAIVEKVTQKIAPTIKDIYEIYYYFVSNNPILKNVLGLAAFSDVVNGAYGQFYNNSYQERHIPRQFLDDHRLLIEKNDSPAIYMASRFNAEAKPFEQFLLGPIAQHKRNKFSTTKEWLEKCEQDLQAAFALLDIRGLGSAILIRHLMGESGDLGADNMLIGYNEKENYHYIINIDVTGFRFPRRHALAPAYPNGPERIGWEATLQSHDTKELTNFLFDESVWNIRFIHKSDLVSSTGNSKAEKDQQVADQKALMATITNILSDKVSKYIAAEVQDVREWLQQQSLEPAIRSLHAAMEQTYFSLNPKVRPADQYLKKIIEHNTAFITDSIQTAKALLEQTVKNVPQKVMNC